MTESLFLQPLDVLYLRGNKLFGEAGSYGEAMMPPWPSLAAGAIRSRMMADASCDFAAFARGQRLGNDGLHHALGTLASPGAFAVTDFRVARGLADGRVEACYPLPADVVVQEIDNTISIRTLAPCALDSGIGSSAVTSQVPVLAENTRAKPMGGYWLLHSGWREYLAGRLLTPDHLVKSTTLWKTDARIGIALDETRRSAADGALFTADAVALCKDVGFVVSIDGAHGHLPKDGLVRLGGDGRAAAVRPVAHTAESPDWAVIDQSRRFRLVLTTPGIFPNGWALPGLTQHGHEQLWQLSGIKAKLISAAVPRAEVVSGWDLVTRQPKTAQRMAPTGSVYWLELLDGNAADLRKLSEQGLWDLPGQTTDAQRRAEGFNRCSLANWRH